MPTQRPPPALRAPPPAGGELTDTGIGQPRRHLMRGIVATLFALFCVALLIQGCAPSTDTPLMREIRKAAADDYRFHDVNLHPVYGEITPTASKLIDDLKLYGFHPTFPDKPIGQLEYLKCGQYYLSRRGGSDAHLTRWARLL